MAKFEPENVLAACNRRDNCRVGIKGLLMRHLPTGREFRNHGLGWLYRSKDEEVLVVHMTEMVVKPPDGTPREEIDRMKSGGIIWADWIQEGSMDPEEDPDNVYARDCVLLERWPVYCCRPGRRKSTLPTGRERG